MCENDNYKYEKIAQILSNSYIFQAVHVLQISERYSSARPKTTESHYIPFDSHRDITEFFLDAIIVSLEIHMAIPFFFSV